MFHDFSVLCVDQLETLERRLKGLSTKFLDEYMVVLQCINNAKANELRSEINQEIQDLFNDEINKTVIFWQETMNKVQKVLGHNL